MLLRRGVNSSSVTLMDGVCGFMLILVLVDVVSMHIMCPNKYPLVFEFFNSLGIVWRIIKASQSF